MWKRSKWVSDAKNFESNRNGSSVQVQWYIVVPIIWLQDAAVPRILIVWDTRAWSLVAARHKLRGCVLPRLGSSRQLRTTVVASEGTVHSRGVHP